MGLAPGAPSIAQRSQSVEAQNVYRALRLDEETNWNACMAHETLGLFVGGRRDSFPTATATAPLSLAHFHHFHKSSPKKFLLPTQRYTSALKQLDQTLIKQRRASW